MLKSKSIDIIKTFSEDELKKFDLFISSPYFNSGKSLIRLFQELKHFYPEFKSDKLTEEYLYGKIFGEGKYSYSLMKNLLSKLFQLCESFLLINKLNKDYIDNSDNLISLTDEYQKRDLDNLYSNRFAILQKKLKTEKYDNYYYRKKISEMNFLLDGDYNKAAFKKTLKDIFFKKSFYELCTILNSLYRNANSIYYISLENNVKTDDNYFFTFLKSIDLEKFLADSSKLKSRENNIPEIYIRLVKLILYPDDANNFLSVKKIIFDNMKKFSNAEKYSLLNILRNYLIYNVLPENKNGAESLSVNLMMLESINFKEDKMESILALIYYGIFTELISNHGLKSAEKFIDDYSRQLRKEVRNDISGYCRAVLSFEKGNFENTLEILSRLKPPNNVYFIYSKNLYLKIYYELNYLDEGLSVIDAYKHYLDNDIHINQNRKDLFNRLIKNFKSLYRLKLKQVKDAGYEAEKLIKDIDKHKLTAELKWIRGKAEEFIINLKKKK